MCTEKICIECGKPGRFKKQVGKWMLLDGTVKFCTVENKVCNQCLHNRIKLKMFSELFQKQGMVLQNIQDFGETIIPIKRGRKVREYQEKIKRELDNGCVAFGWAFKHILR